MRHAPARVSPRLNGRISMVLHVAVQMDPLDKINIAGDIDLVERVHLDGDMQDHRNSPVQTRRNSRWRMAHGQPDSSRPRTRASILSKCGAVPRLSTGRPGKFSLNRPAPVSGLGRMVGAAAQYPKNRNQDEGYRDSRRNGGIEGIDF